MGPISEFGVPLPPGFIFMLSHQPYTQILAGSATIIHHKVPRKNNITFAERYGLCNILQIKHQNKCWGWKQCTVWKSLFSSLTALNPIPFHFYPQQDLVREDGVEPPQLTPLVYSQLVSPLDLCARLFLATNITTSLNSLNVRCFNPFLI